MKAATEAVLKDWLGVRTKGLVHFLKRLPPLNPEAREVVCFLLLLCASVCVPGIELRSSVLAAIAFTHLIGSHFISFLSF